VEEDRHRRQTTRKMSAHLAGAVRAKKSVPVAVVKRDLGGVDQQATVVRERVLVDLDVATLGVRREHAGR
jgi:phosphoribosylcarboxyaminoimidazole (NCAIR) mutase